MAVVVVKVCVVLFVLTVLFSQGLARKSKELTDVINCYNNVVM